LPKIPTCEDGSHPLFDFMIDVVNEHQKIVNKFLGDGFMAVFGAPIDDAERCAHARLKTLLVSALIHGKHSRQGTKVS
jgi:adenylate cyclase